MTLSVDRMDDGADRPCVHSGVARHSDAAVRLLGRIDHRAAGGIDPDPGVLQFGPRLLAQQESRREAQHGRSVGADRRVQLL